MAGTLQVFTSARAALESTRGTDLTPTRIIYAESFEHVQNVATILPLEHRASYFATYSSAAGPEDNTLTMTGRVTYDDLIWHANMFFKGVSSGTGAGADKTWTFLPSSAADDVKTCTVQLGDATNISATLPGVKLNGVFGNNFNIHFEKNGDGAATFKSEFLVQKAATQITAFTGALSDRNGLIPASCNNTQVTIDTTTIGTTTDSAVLSVDFNLALAPQPLDTLDGTTSHNQVLRPNFRDWTATIVRQYANHTEWDPYVSKVPRKVRVTTTGPSLGGSNYKVQLDMYGVYTARTWTDVNGIITETLTLENIYDSTALTDHQLIVVNATASIT